MHNHKEAEIIRVSKGSIRAMMFDGRSFILESGDLCYMNCDVPHETQSLCTETDIQMFQFEPQSFFKGNPVAAKKYLIACMNTSNKAYCVYRQHAEMNELFDKMDTIMGAKKKAYDISALGIIYEMFGCLFNEDTIVLCNEGEKELEQISDVLIYINENYTENISLTEIAHKMHISVSHFCKIFKSATGKSFVDYINSRRLYEAESLLRKNQQSIIEIAMLVGFSSVAYFDRLFKRHYGINPGKYRKMILENSGNTFIH